MSNALSKMLRTRAVIGFVAAVISCGSAANAQLITRSTFEYQGRLSNSGAPYTGSADVIATLYSNSVGGAVIGGPLSIPNIAVSNGVFTAPMDFGVVEPQGRRYLEIQVRTPSGSGGYSTLSPRSVVDVTPRAASAIRAESAEPFNVAYNASPITLDQSQTKIEATSTQTSSWQSFTAGATGPLTHVAFFRNGSVNISNMSLRVYAGEGTGGTLLYQQTIGTNGVVGEVVYGLVQPVNVTLGQKYTVEVLQTGGGTISFYYATGNPYAGGTSGVGLNADYYFKTWIGVAPGDVTLRSRYFGVNTPVPAAPLHVSGDSAVVANIEGSSTIGTWFNVSNTSVGGVYWRMISTGSGNGEGTGKLLLGYGPNAGSQGTVMTLQQNGNVGIGTATPAQRLTVNGNVLANNVAVPSSIRFKDHVAVMDDALASLMKLEGVRFDWKPEWAKERPGREHDIGFVAEDVQKVFPEIVFRDAGGAVVGMDYSRLTAVAVQAIKQQQAQRDADKKELERLAGENVEKQKEIDELRTRLEKLEAAIAERSRTR